jgi:hypothetical protein
MPRWLAYLFIVLFLVQVLYYVLATVGLWPW